MLTKSFQPKTSIGAVLLINHDITCQTLPPATSQPTSKRRTLKSFFLPSSLLFKSPQFAISLSQIPQRIGK